MDENTALEFERENPIFNPDYPVWTIVNTLVKSHLSFFQSIEAPARLDDGSKNLLVFTDEDGAKTYLEGKLDGAGFSPQAIESSHDLLDICLVLEASYGFTYITIDFYRKANLRKEYPLRLFISYLQGKIAISNNGAHSDQE